MSTADLHKNPVFIVGVAETPLGEVYDHTEYSMFAPAAREALAEAGMTLKDVDGLFVNYMGEEGPVQVGEYLDLQPRYAGSSDLGGAGSKLSCITPCWQLRPGAARWR